MPMDFPDLKSLAVHSKMITPNFREPEENETEEHYREALADHVQPIDFLESVEIRNKVGWDKFSKEQNNDMLRRSDFSIS